MANIFDSFKDMANTAQGVHTKPQQSYPGTDEAEPAYISGAVMSQPTRSKPLQTVGTPYKGAYSEGRACEAHEGRVCETHEGRVCETHEYPLNIAIIQKLVTYDQNIGGPQQPAIAYVCQIAGKMPANAKRKFYGLDPDSTGARVYKEVHGEIEFDARTSNPIVLTLDELHSIIKPFIDRPNVDKIINMVGASISSDGKGGVRIYDVKAQTVGVADKIPYGNRVLTKLKPEFMGVSNVLGFVDTFKY